MIINENFVLRQVIDTWVVLPLAAETVNFNGMITLNESGVLLWKVLENSADVDSLIDALRSEYDVSEQHARLDVMEFIEKLRSAGCINEEQ